MSPTITEPTTLSATVGLQARILKASSGLWLSAPGVAASTLSPAKGTMSSLHYNIGIRGGQHGQLAAHKSWQARPTSWAGEQLL